MTDADLEDDVAPVVLCLVNNTQAPPCGPMSSITNPARSGLRVKSASVPTTVHLNAC